MKVLVLVFVCVLFSGVASSQDQNIDSLFLAGICTQSGFTIPTLKGMPRGKGLEVYQERVPNFRLTSNLSAPDSVFSKEIRRTKSWMVNIRLPMVNKDHFKFLVGLKYYQQEFAFDDPDRIGNSFYQSLQDKPIRSVGLTLYGVKSFLGNKYLLGRGAVRLNGDFRSDIDEHIKSTFAMIYGVKRHKHSTWGLGASYSNTFGNSSLYPVFLYKNRFRPKWAVELLLPVSARLMFRPNSKNIFYFDSKLEGDNYNLNFEGFSNESLYLEKSDFKSFLTYEREVYDFFWVGASAGVRFNLNFNVSDSDVYFERNFPVGSSEEIVISNSLSDALFFRFGVFLVPPQKWLND